MKTVVYESKRTSEKFIFVYFVSISFLTLFSYILFVLILLLFILYFPGVTGGSRDINDYVITEKWRDVEQILPGEIHILQILKAWGTARHEVTITPFIQI